MRLFKNDKQTLAAACWLSVLNLLLFHFPFYRFVCQHLDYTRLGGMVVIASLVILMLVANAFFFYILLYLLRVAGKILLSLFFILNAVAVYFVFTYGVIIDESMIGNVFHTNSEESSSFFSFKLVAYVLLLGVLPSWFIFRWRLIRETGKRFLLNLGLALLFMAVMVFANASHWLWIDKNSKSLGGLAMPWSYTVNTILFHVHEYQKNKKEIRLPDATLKDSAKSIVVLVIGESARSANFSLYGYGQQTNPRLTGMPNLHVLPARSCATYTSAGIKCILEHAHTGELYEILPNYLYRNNVEVIWRSTNWGEPPIHIKQFRNKTALQQDYPGPWAEYDEILLQGLNEQIRASRSNKILVVLHTSTSHGPTYSKKYPPAFEVFKPVCQSVELGNCSRKELIHAYDNTIVYTDYLLHQVIQRLKEMPEYTSCMMFVSDHGESLGEKNLYMHGMPMSLAPREQYEIPFLVWLSDDSRRQLKTMTDVSQNHVFHSVLNFLGVQSPVYNEELNLFR